MFTGIIEDLGTIASFTKSGSVARIKVDTNLPLDEIKLGDSIAVNGACLTVSQLAPPYFEVDVSAETLDKTSLGRLRNGDRVNLERAARVSGRLDGHLVTGHVDNIGIIKSKTKEANTHRIVIKIGEASARMCVNKGSITIDGISLTINELMVDSVSLTIIPHTAEFTTIGFKRAGDVVNIETDIIGKYVQRFLSEPLQNSDTATSITEQRLSMLGYM